MRIAVLFAVLFLAACPATVPEIGKGPITLSNSVTKYYREKYLKTPGPDYFIVNAAGTFATYTYCTSGTGDCSNQGALQRVLSRCAKRVGKPCYVFDHFGNVVWEGPVQYGGSSRSRNPATMDDKQLCNFALRRNSEPPVWDTNSRYTKYVGEASGRNLTPADCAKLLGQ